MISVWLGDVTAQEVPLALTQPPQCDPTVTVAPLVPFAAVATAAGWHLQVRNLLIVVAQGLDKLVLVHLGTSLDADLPGALLQVLL